MQRNIIVDSMRIIGLYLIILAHVFPPETLFQLRSFDVPMMVFISGMAYYCAGKSDISIFPYVISRFQRLVFPVWAFLVLFFSIIFVFKISIFYNFLNLKTILTSFLLLNGIGYVWIIRVFLIIAILSPFFVSIVKGKSGMYATLISLLIICLSSALSFVGINNEVVSHLLKDIIIPTFTYGAIFMLGYKCLSMKRTEKTLTFIFFSVLFISMAAYTYLSKGIILGPQDFKYPPTLYFASYSIAMTYVTMGLLTLFLKNKSDLPYFLNFISSNTIWIYLWHIPIVECFKITHIIDNFAIKYLITLALSISITYLQTSLIKKTTKRKLIRNIFTG